jgi:hypothetical protein
LTLSTDRVVEVLMAARITFEMRVEVKEMEG